MSLMGDDSTGQIKQLISLIDLTDLSDDCTDASVEQLCAQARTPLGPVAAVCVWPDYVALARDCLQGQTSIGIATVVNFPAGDKSIQTSCALIDTAVLQGATEIDYVMPYQQLLAGNLRNVEANLQAIRSCISGDVHLKVILETGVLGTQEAIRLASEIAIEQGADFIKTSTGKVGINATPEAARIMLEVIASMNKSVGFKPAGGIRSVKDALIYMQIAEQKLGSQWLTPEHFRLGASSLLQDALDQAHI